MSGVGELAIRYAALIKVPKQGDFVYKDECVYSFASPEDADGLFVNMNSLEAVGREFLDKDFSKGFGAYLNIKSRRYKKNKKKNEEKLGHVPKKMAIGVEGGFDLSEDHYETKTEYSLVFMPGEVRIGFPFTESFPNKEVYEKCIEAIISKEDSTKIVPFFIPNERQVSKYALELVQLDNGKKISPNPKDWKCEESGMTENLWLNLSTGYIGSGRRYEDGTGGTGAALRHFEETGGIFPLVVKLGTITPHGADVYSYAPDENDMVVDPHLSKHLAHWGINMMEMEKTDKTMEELDIDQNMRADLFSIQEKGKQLDPLYGKGYVGLINTGNSCYINSVVQVLSSLPEFQTRYIGLCDMIFSSSSRSAAGDLNTQFAKLIVATQSEKYLKPEPMDTDADVTSEWILVHPSRSIAPKMLRAVLGRNHLEFSTSRQQDAHEYYQHVLDQITKAERASNITSLDSIGSLPKLLTFSIEERYECDVSHQVKYVQVENENTLTLAIPIEKALNLAEVNEYNERVNAMQDSGISKQDIAKVAAPKPVVPFSACIEEFIKPEKLDSFYSTATKSRGPAAKTTRLASFPPYLFVKMKRYVLSSDWTPKKLDASVSVPESFDFSVLRGFGIQPGETELPVETSGSSKEIEPNMDIVSQLLSMGFSENGCKRAVIATQNSGVEQATNWIFEHMGDPDFNDPLPSKKTGAQVNPESLMMLESMGFQRKHAEKALQETAGDIERAAEWLFSRTGTLISLDSSYSLGELDQDSGDHKSVDDAKYDGKGEYELIAIISHIGSNTTSGHYICHIKKDGMWAIFNDEKVAKSENPPFDLGYMYLFKRKDYSSP